MNEDYKENRNDADEWYFTPEEPKEKKPKKKEFSAKKRFWIAFLMGAVVSAILIVGIAFIFDENDNTVLISNEDYEYYKELADKYGKYNFILEMVEADPLAETTPEAITDEDLKQILANSGDPYAKYYTEEEYKAFTKSLTSSYVGVGIVIADSDDGIVVLGVMEDGPAEEAGMKPGDIIVKVDGDTPEDSGEAVDMISGKAGTAVTITISRDGEKSDLKMNRAEIEQNSVSSSQLDEDETVGVIQITSFVEGTADDFKLAVKELKNKGCDKFILDLRNNGGGLTDESVEIADYLLPECKIMTEKNKAGEETIYNSKASSADLDVVVLVNENTASASEILAGALQDNNAATIIGKTTYGKGVTQGTHQFSDGTAIKITITEYFRPSGKTVQGVGITPDIEASNDDILDKAIEELDK